GLPLPAGALQLYLPPDEGGERRPSAQLVEKLGGESHFPFLSREGARGWVKRLGKLRSFRRIASNTPSIFFPTSALVKRNTTRPLSPSHASRMVSFTGSWVSPSTSTTRPFAEQKKSQMNGSITV